MEPHFDIGTRIVLAFLLSIAIGTIGLIGTAKLGVKLHVRYCQDVDCSRR